MFNLLGTFCKVSRLPQLNLLSGWALFTSFLNAEYLAFVGDTKVFVYSECTAFTSLATDSCYNKGSTKNCPNISRHSINPGSANSI